MFLELKVLIRKVSEEDVFVMMVFFAYLAIKISANGLMDKLNDKIM